MKTPKKTDYKNHPLSSMFRDLNEAEFEALKNDISEQGQIQDIILHAGKILDGRYKACRELNIEPEFTELQGTEAQAVELVISLNLHRRHITNQEKRAVVENVLQKYPSLSNRAIARMTDSSHTHVGELREELEAKHQLEAVAKTIGKGGKKYPRKRKSRQRKHQTKRRHRTGLTPPILWRKCWLHSNPGHEQCRCIERWGKS